MRNNLFGKSFIQTPYKKVAMDVSYFTQDLETSAITEPTTSWVLTTSRDTNWSSLFATDRQTLLSTQTHQVTNQLTNYTTEWNYTTSQLTNDVGTFSWSGDISTSHVTNWTSYWDTSFNSTLTSYNLGGSFSGTSYTNGTLSIRWQTNVNGVNVVNDTTGTWSNTSSTTGVWSVSGGTFTASGTFSGDGITASGTGTFGFYDSNYSANGTVSFSLQSSGAMSGTTNGTWSYSSITSRQTSYDTSYTTQKMTTYTWTSSYNTNILTYWQVPTSATTSATTTWNSNWTTFFNGTTSWNTNQDTSNTTTWDYTTSRISAYTTTWNTWQSTTEPVLNDRYGYNVKLNILVIGDDVTGNYIDGLTDNGSQNTYEMDLSGNWVVAEAPSVSPLATGAMSSTISVLGKEILKKSNYFAEVDIANISVADTSLGTWLSSATNADYTLRDDDAFTYADNKLFERIQFAIDNFGDGINVVVLNINNYDVANGTDEATYTGYMNALKQDLIDLGVEPLFIINKMGTSVKNAQDAFIADKSHVAIDGIDLDTFTTDELLNGVLTIDGSNRYVNELSDIIIEKFN